MLKLRKTVTEEGKTKIEIEIDGVWIKRPGGRTSRKITGTSGEYGFGVFGGGSDTLNFGEYKKYFTFSKLDYTESAAEIAKVLQDRIDQVRAWVAECRSKACTETVEVLSSEQVVEKLQEESRLLYRNKSDQIQTLDI